MYVDVILVSFVISVSPLLTYHLNPFHIRFLPHMQNHRRQSTFSQLSDHVYPKIEIVNLCTPHFHSGSGVSPSLASFGQSSVSRSSKNPATRSLSKPYLRAWAGPAVPFSHLRFHFRKLVFFSLGKVACNLEIFDFWEGSRKRDLQRENRRKLPHWVVCWYLICSYFLLIHLHQQQHPS
ncbi:hypothetical protein B0T13DRAFT_45688 [Neurospora crassa]|nr:hypothetical protein B0T13DRAFT_45688 [Neurospora crassa]